MVSKYRLSQNVEKRIFIGSRLREIQTSLKNAEDEYEKFKQANRKILQSPSLIIEEQRLLREIELQSQVYITLRTEFQLAEIEEAGNSNLIQVLDEQNNLYEHLNFHQFHAYAIHHHAIHNLDTNYEYQLYLLLL